MNIRKIAVYGSLRRGEYNFNRMSKFGKIDYIETTSIEGYDLYSLGPYPGIKKGKGTIVVDILEVGEELFGVIDAMEKGAEYSPEIINISDEDVILYVYNGNTRDTNLVESGDWSDYLNLIKR